MSRDRNKALIDALHAIWCSGNLGAIPDVYASDFVVHWAKSAHDPETRGHEGIRQAIAGLKDSFPDWHERVVDMVIEGDRVVTRYISTGTHLGTFNGIKPTVNRIEIDEMSIYRIEDGKVAEQWCLADDLMLLRQIGGG